MRKLLLTIVLVLALSASLFAFASCGEEDPVATTDKVFIDDPNLEEITFVLDWAPNTNHTGLYVARELGYFAEEGFKVNIVQPGDTGTSAQVAAGNGTFGIDFQEQMIWNETSKVGVTAVAAVIQHNTSGIVSPKSKGIATPSDMAGKKYATWGLPGEQAIVRSMNNDVVMIPNTIKDIIGEFKNPQGVDMVWSYAAWDKIFLDQAKIESNFIWMRDIEGLDYYTPVIIANNKYLSEKPDRAKAFMKAVSRGYEYAIENPRSAGYILMKANPELCESRDVVYASMNFLAKEYKSDARMWGRIDQTRWDGFFTLMCKNETKDENGDRIFPTAITAHYGYTNEYLPGYDATLD